MGSRGAQPETAGIPIEQMDDIFGFRTTGTASYKSDPESGSVEGKDMKEHIEAA